MINWSKPIETADGRPARKITTTRIEQSHIIFVPSQDWGDIFLVNDSGFRCDDRAPFSARQEPFIRNVKVKKEGWQTIHRTRHGKYTGSILYESEELAHKAGSQFSDYVATVKIEWEE
jgi:hypothetical protein